MNKTKRYTSNVDFVIDYVSKYNNLKFVLETRNFNPKVSSIEELSGMAYFVYESGNIEREGIGLKVEGVGENVITIIHD